MHNAYPTKCARSEKNLRKFTFMTHSNGRSLALACQSPLRGDQFIIFFLPICPASKIKILNMNIYTDIYVVFAWTY